MNDITREDAVKWLTNLRDDCGRHQDMWHYAEALDQIIELLSADVAPVRHGRWEEQKITFNVWGDDVVTEKTLWRCSVCGHEDSILTNYCSNCGAKMDGEDDA